MAHNTVGVHSIRFNHDFSCFAVGMDQGCRIFNVVPFREKLNLPHDVVGSVYICEMLHRSNLLAIVGGGVLPKFADNTLLLWDDVLKEFVYELTFDLPVLAVRMRRDLLIAVLRNRIHVFTFPDPIEKLLTLDTRDNPRGLCALSRTIANQILAFPGPRSGTVQILDLEGASTHKLHSKAPSIINAHKTELAAMTLNADSSLLATASTKGTLIRIWDTYTKHKLIELRRGMEPARLYSVAFSPDSEMLVCASDRGTCHVFAVRQAEFNRKMMMMPQSIGSLIKNPISDSQWSFTQFQIPAEITCVVGFCSSQEIIALTIDGKFYKYVLTSRPTSSSSSSTSSLASMENVVAGMSPSSVAAGGGALAASPPSHLTLNSSGGSATRAGGRSRSNPKRLIGTIHCQCTEYDTFVSYDDEDWLQNA